MLVIDLMDKNIIWKTKQWERFFLPIHCDKYQFYCLKVLESALN